MAKKVNYTEEQTLELTRGYIAVAGEAESVRDAFVKEMAEKYGKNIRSIRAKLSRENVYIAKTPVAKDGSPVVRKSELVANLGVAVGRDVDSAINMTKNDLKTIIACIEELRDQIADDAAENFDRD